MDVIYWGGYITITELTEENFRYSKNDHSEFLSIDSLPPQTMIEILEKIRFLIRG